MSLKTTGPKKNNISSKKVVLKPTSVIDRDKKN